MDENLHAINYNDGSLITRAQSPSKFNATTEARIIPFDDYNYFER